MDFRLGDNGHEVGELPPLLLKLSSEPLDVRIGVVFPLREPAPKYFLFLGRPGPRFTGVLLPPASSFLIKKREHNYI